MGIQAPVDTSLPQLLHLCLKKHLKIRGKEDFKSQSIRESILCVPFLEIFAKTINNYINIHTQKGQEKSH